MRALVTAASRHGATHEIATAIAAGLARRGVEADARPAEELESLDGYDAYVIGSAVYVGRWLEPARGLVESNAAALATHPVWLFSSGPLGPPDKLKPEGDPVDVAGLIETTDAVEHRIFAGRLDRTLLSFGEGGRRRSARPGGRLPRLGRDRRLRRHHRRAALAPAQN